MLKNLLILLFKIIAEPASTWIRLEKELSIKQDRNNKDFYKGYLFPVLGIIALSSFVGVLISSSFDVLALQKILKVVIKQIMIYGGSFYIMSYLFTEFIFPHFKMDKDKALVEQFVGYASSLVYAVAMTKALFPSLFLLEIVVFYTVYILWMGAIYFLKIKENLLIKFTIFASVIILFTPFLLDRLIGWLIPGMKNIA